MTGKNRHAIAVIIDVIIMAWPRRLLSWHSDMYAIFAEAGPDTLRLYENRILKLNNISLLFGLFQKEYNLQESIEKPEHDQ